MMQRRHFLGTMAATCLATTALPIAAQDQLNWSCDAVQTLPQAPKKRAPVVTGVCLSPDESQLVVVGDDHFVSVFDLAAKRFARTLSAHRDWVRAAAFSANGKRLATVGNDRMVLLWDAATWSNPIMLAHQAHAVFDVAFAPQTPMLATVGFGKTLNLFDLETNQQTAQLECSCEDMHAVGFNQDGSLVAAGGRDGVIRVWNVAQRSVVAEYQGHRQRIRSLEFQSNGNILSCGDDQLVQSADPFRKDNVVALPRQLCKLFAVTLLGDDLCATSGSDNQIGIWQLSTQQQLGILAGHTGTVSCLTASPKLLVSGSYDTQIRVWHRTEQTGLPGDRQTKFEPGWSSRVK